MLEPIFNNIIVKVPDEKKETEGGIVIPDTHTADRPQRGTVISVGSEAQAVKIGNDIVFRKYSPDVIEIDGEKHWILAESDVIAIIR